MNALTILSFFRLDIGLPDGAVFETPSSQDGQERPARLPGDWQGLNFTASKGLILPQYKCGIPSMLSGLGAVLGFSLEASDKLSCGYKHRNSRSSSLISFLNLR